MQIEVAHQWSTGKGVRIAVVDSGIDIGHPDLLGRVALFRDLTGLSGDGQQMETHGLAVAGIIAAAAGNGKGIVGVAPDAKSWRCARAGKRRRRTGLPRPDAIPLPWLRRLPLRSRTAPM